MGRQFGKIYDESGNAIQMEPYVIILARHGQPKWDSNGIGIDEPELTEKGRRQAEALGECLSRLPITDFYVSSLLRARLTAAPLAERIGREPTVAPWYREIAAKNLDGYTTDEVKAYYEAWWKLPPAQRFDGPEGGETLAQIYDRVAGGIDKVLLDAGFSFTGEGRDRTWKLPPEPRCVVLVGHTFASSTALCHLLNLEYTGISGEQFRMGWGAYNKLVVFPAGGGYVWRLAELNSCGHLRARGLIDDDIPTFEQDCLY